MSAGNTGALMGAVRVPAAHGARYRSSGHRRLLSDRAGREPPCWTSAPSGVDANNLVEFAIMGEVFARIVLGVKSHRSACSMWARRS